eukprot:scaffold273703_cov19-Prasinocladus_malaysianus.AAC.1
MGRKREIVPFEKVLVSFVGLEPGDAILGSEPSHGGARILRQGFAPDWSDERWLCQAASHHPPGKSDRPSRGPFALPATLNALHE